MGHPITTITPCRLAEMTFAYERASGIIETECVMPEKNGWYDLNTANVDLLDEVTYLEARRLLVRHPEHPLWVQILDEGEPLPGVEVPAGEPGLRIREVGTVPSPKIVPIVNDVAYNVTVPGARCTFWSTGSHIVYNGNCRCGKRFQIAEVIG